MAHICSVLFIICFALEGIWIWDPWHSFAHSSTLFSVLFATPALSGAPSMSLAHLSHCNYLVCFLGRNSVFHHRWRTWEAKNVGSWVQVTIRDLLVDSSLLGAGAGSECCNIWIWSCSCLLYPWTLWRWAQLQSKLRAREVFFFFFHPLGELWAFPIVSYNIIKTHLLYMCIF